MPHPRQFKTEALERLLEQHKDRLKPHVCQSIQRIVARGADPLDLNTLNGLCRDQECLPTDILRAV